eukprot:m.446314 g.446314  ORF g.446314 m.446314 type:complete len:216 (+) comp19344_c0_seq1:33-680(+)
MAHQSCRTVAPLLRALCRPGPVCYTAPSQAMQSRCHSGGPASNAKWDGGVTSTAKHQRFHRPSPSSPVPEAVQHRPSPRVVATSDGRRVVNGNPVSHWYARSTDHDRGFGTEKSIKHFQHRLRLRLTGRHVYTELTRPDGTTILTASTLEWPIARHLYSGADKTACANLGAVIAARLKESGITSVFFDREGRSYHGKMKSFIDAVVDSGISLKER